MSISAEWLLVVPMVVLLAGLVCRLLPCAKAADLAVRASVLACALALLLAGFAGASLTGWIELDLVGRVMLVLVSLLGAVVIRFSRHYLAGDPNQGRFLSWMALTLTSVLLLVISGHLVLLLVAWVMTSLCLHLLLLHRPDRAGAVFAARKKFVFSRLADLCLLAAVAILGLGHGIWTFAELKEAAGGSQLPMGVLAVLLALCALLKSAQFPFHTWLPDTMETPTPVSAFMHAGIINAGGFLVIRFAPVFEAAVVGPTILVVVGTLSAAFGAMVMLAQPSVKRSLAFSTIAQMGFMLLQCGLGAYGLALIHIVAHSLYKAHAFLTAGSTVGAVPRSSIALKWSALGVGVLAGALMVAAGSTLLHLILPVGASQPMVFLVVLALSLAYGIARSVSSVAGVSILGRALGMAAVVTLLSMGLHALAGQLGLDAREFAAPLWQVIAVSAVFVALFLFQALHWRAHRHPLGRSFYVHCLNGFYLGTLGNRLLGKLWPRHPVS